ncbi:gamma subclass chorismate mutase AroQ [Prosthecobacter sp.]|uniref:gamma subclass chorismate mutase AroQ n=1 Tax=Prosthecobacter sp. TaxID=1965333 RepID=UPI0037847A5F
MNFVSSSRLLGAFALALVFSNCAGMGGSRSALPRLMVQRLDWMDDVALAKSVKKMPIHDPKREAELLAAMTQRGVAAGLQAENVRRFFSGQMEAAKVVQEEWLQRHPHGLTSYVMVPDLSKTIRPALDEIGNKLIQQLALQARRQSSQEEALQILSRARKRLKRAGYSDAVIAPAIEGLQAGLTLVPCDAEPLKPGGNAPPKGGYPFRFSALTGKKDIQPQ